MSALIVIRRSVARNHGDRELSSTVVASPVPTVGLSAELDGWIELVLNDAGDVVAHTIAATEKDAWKAAQVVLRRKGYAVS